MPRSLSIAFALVVGCSGPEPARDEAAVTPVSSPSAAAGEVAPFPVPAGFPDAPEHHLAPDRAPTPYTAAEIRGACGKGRTTKWRMVTPKGEFISVHRFISADAKGARWQSLLVRADGVQQDSKELTGTWDELQSHASYPAADTRITAGRTDVPAGEYDCWIYEVEEKGSVTTYWFAKDLPGPPIRIEILQGPRRVLDMQLVEVLRAR